MVFIRLKELLPHHFLVANFAILKKEYPVTNSLFKENFCQKTKNFSKSRQKSPQLPTI
jgi:hypothetical protein